MTATGDLDVGGDRSLALRNSGAADTCHVTRLQGHLI
jgi:hypothetical protein